jgi:glucokinase-like ROK family protein
MMIRESDEKELSWLNTGRSNGKEGADARLVGELNRSIILNFIRLEGSISRADIAHRTKLSRSAVSNIISSLLDEGIVQETGTGESKGGRRPIMVNFNYTAGYILGVDLGSNHLLTLVTDLEGNPIEEFSAPFSVDMGPERGLPVLIEHIQSVLNKPMMKGKRVVGLGIGVPGPLDYTTGTIVAPPIMPGWNNVPLRQKLLELLNIEVLVENDANLGAIGERWKGAGQGKQQLAYIKIGTGIGCGLIMDGKIYRGSRGSAGEIGHITISPDGPPCKCGNSGCLESMAAGPAIVNRAILAIQAKRESMIRLEMLHTEQAIQEIAQAAHNGDALAQELFRNAGRHIGTAIANLINLFNPEMVIIGGGVADAGDLLLNPIQETVKRRSLPSNYNDTVIACAQLGREAIAIGAATMVLQEVFKGPKLAISK